MNEFGRLLEQEETSAQARQLLQSHPASTTMPDAARAALGAHAAQLAATGAVSSVLVTKILLGTLLAVGVGGAVVWSTWDRHDVIPTQIVQAEGTPPSPAVEAPPDDVHTESPAPDVPVAAPVRAPEPKVRPKRVVDPAPSNPIGEVEVEAPPSGLSSLAEEQRLLERARLQLDAEPTAALALAEEHTRRFADGQLTDLREYIAIQALEALGRTRLARQRCDDFASHHASSAFKKRVDAIRTRLDDEDGRAEDEDPTF